MIGAMLKVVLLPIFVGLLLIVPLGASNSVDGVSGIEPIAKLRLIENPAKPMGLAIFGGALLRATARRLSSACNRRLNGQSDGIHLSPISARTKAPLDPISRRIGSCAQNRL